MSEGGMEMPGRQEINLEELTAEEAALAIRSRGICILPLGSTEQHGPHLPVGTDTILAQELARRVARKIGGVLLPALPFGQIWSANRFPGTIALTEETLVSLLCDVIESLARQGARVVALLSAHMGNLAPAQKAARQLKDWMDVKVLAFAYPRVHEIAEGITQSALWQGSVFHAAEIETSMVLAVRPDLCRMDRAICSYPEAPADWEFRPYRWDELNPSGVFGDATVATAEKGEALLARWTTLIAEAIERSDQQV
jgi:creatinine amidohydrolase